MSVVKANAERRKLKGSVGNTAMLEQRGAKVGATQAHYSVYDETQGKNSFTLKAIKYHHYSSKTTTTINKFVYIYSQV